MFYERLYYDIAILSCGKDGIYGCKDRDEVKKVERRWNTKRESKYLSDERLIRY